MKQLTTLLILTLLQISGFVFAQNDSSLKKCSDKGHPHMIDLGLPSGLKWACCNVGATKPEEYGGYYAWGENNEKEVYNYLNYQYVDGRDTNGDGIYDDKVVWISLGNNICRTKRDVAFTEWGSAWQMPEQEHFKELITNCRYEWITVNGIKGGKFTGPNGNSIFFPAAGFHIDSEFKSLNGCGHYWAGKSLVNRFGSSPNIDSIAPGLYVGSQATFPLSGASRRCGNSVRPIAIDGASVMQKPEELVEPVYSKMITDGDEVYTNVDQSPVFPGGERGLMSHINKNTLPKNSLMDADPNSKTIIYVRLIVEKDGKVSNVGMESYKAIRDGKPIKMSEEALEPFVKEAVRVIGLTTGRWEPGTLKGEHVRVKLFVPVTFYQPKDSSKNADDKSKPTVSKDDQQHKIEAVDLGLPSGTKWANMNIGATKPEEVGDYYAWGETETKKVYDGDSYKYDDEEKLGKNICGTKYDVAHVKWGGNWKMPTSEQMEELINNCDIYNGIELNGVKGFKIKGPNGNSIFLPCSGKILDSKVAGPDIQGCYWSGTRFYHENLPFRCAHALVLYYKERIDKDFVLSPCSLVDGLPVRPVTK